MSAEALPPLDDAAAAAVREASREGLAVSPADVSAALEAAGRDLSEPDALARIEAALAAHPGLASFAGLAGGRLFHDPTLLSRTYARIIDRKAVPLALMAEEIRHASREYPRPLPIELFSRPPFDLTGEAIGQALRAMADAPDYADIAFTVTAAGNVYLFSTNHLTRHYADFLAERADGLAGNP